ncbi:MAG: dephospho-CoA kinase [Verrucomicrobia bacterium]|nr:dephospho-CoA kinase [Verrucomicrobiota bacterium]
MITMGLTGGIGAGKSEASDHLKRLGIPVLDTDVVARELVYPGQPALAEIVAAFGSGILDFQGHLDRTRLGLRVFEDSAALQQLEAILHPRIYEGWTAWTREQALHDHHFCAVVIPLLYEKGYDSHFQVTVALGCTPQTQRQRLHQRQWTDQMIDQRLAAQWPMSEKLQRANYCLWSEGRRDVLHQQIEVVLKSVGYPWSP